MTALPKQPLTVNFAQGLDQKNDPKQIALDKFLMYRNVRRDVGGLLQKRFGFDKLVALPAAASFLTTFNGALTAIGTTFQAFADQARTWVSKGPIQTVALSVLPLIRSNTNQSQADAAVSTNGLVCTVFSDFNGSTTTYKYAVVDQETGQNVVAPTLIPPLTGAISGAPRVFFLGTYFVIVFNNVITAVNHLQYIALDSMNPSTVTTNVDISISYTPNSHLAVDGVVTNNNLYLAWNGSDGGGAIRVTRISSDLGAHATVVFAGRTASIMSACVDASTNTPLIFFTFWESGGATGYTLAVNSILATVLAPTQWLAAGDVGNISTAATNQTVSIYYEINQTYGGAIGGVVSNLINKKTVISPAGTVSSASVVARSVGLASKAFIYSGVQYFLAAYQSTHQNTYFLLNSSGNVIAKLCYSNGGGYCPTGTPAISISGTTISVPYLRKDSLNAVNKDNNIGITGGVYAQTGVNFATFDMAPGKLSTAEIGSNLHLSGGFLWAYDGYSPVEQGFHLWPEPIAVTQTASGGSISAQLYYYQAVYEWSDNQGNIHRSAPSIPVSIDVVAGSTTNTITVPTLRLTYKTANPVKIVLYRWSTATPLFYRTSSISVPTLNNPAADTVTITDTNADATIIGNDLIYTTGGVVENIGPPATNVVALFNNRLALIDAEDPNLLWISKQVIENVPVEMSDLLTQYVAPTIASQGSTGPTRTIAAMDDKLILGKDQAFYYIAGNGPDATGANNQYSEPIFITSTVGCANQASIVFTPNGLMFQSVGKGIWLLGRDLQTSYIGSPVAGYNDATVVSAISVPETNEIRFQLDSGVTLVYDYFYGQWGTSDAPAGLSGTIFESRHTYLAADGRVLQNSDGYTDDASPVLLAFQTSWLKLAGIQGFQRAYFFYLLGEFITPHKLAVSMSYDYSQSPSQRELLEPDNYSPNYGDQDGNYGDSSPYGGPGNSEEFRVFFEQQKCKALSITVQELYDPTPGVPPGAGLTLSGLTFIAAIKKGYTTLKASNSK